MSLRIDLLNGQKELGTYEAILDDLKALKAPVEAREAQRFLTEAIADQEQVFVSRNDRDKHRSEVFLSSSHQKLLKTYSVLLKAYPQNEHNKKAFFDYFCALDFN